MMIALISPVRQRGSDSVGGGETARMIIFFSFRQSYVPIASGNSSMKFATQLPPVKTTIIFCIQQSKRISCYKSRTKLETESREINPSDGANNRNRVTT